MTTAELDLHAEPFADPLPQVPHELDTTMANHMVDMVLARVRPEITRNFGVKVAWADKARAKIYDMLGDGYQPWEAYADTLVVMLDHIKQYD